jgi:hypothetical protein
MLNFTAAIPGASFTHTGKLMCECMYVCMYAYVLNFTAVVLGVSLTHTGKAICECMHVCTFVCMYHP